MIRPLASSAGGSTAYPAAGRANTAVMAIMVPSIYRQVHAEDGPEIPSIGTMSGYWYDVSPHTARSPHLMYTQRGPHSSLYWHEFPTARSPH